MLTHWFIGALLFYSARFWLGIEFAPWALADILIGGIIGGMADIPSWFGGFSWTKNSHDHRRGLAHSILWFPIPVALACLLSWQHGLLVLAVLLSHPFLDSFGLGFGVSIFYPLSKGRLYLQYPGRYWYPEIGICAIERQKNDNKWLKKIFWTWPSDRPWILGFEVASAIGLGVLMYVS